MALSRDDQIRAIADACTDMHGEDRANYLANACQDDLDLQQTVEMILENGTENGNASSASDQLERSLPSYYRLIRLLGAGGMAEVFLAEDTRLGRPVAIKFLNQTFRANPDLMRRFNLEARAASALNHPNIITIHDIGEKDGLQYIVSEYIDGESLRRRLKRGPLSIRECLDITTRIASALQAAHAVGIVHRDLKPDNIMLRQDGSVKVVDFGLAKAAGNPTSASDEALTLDEGMTSPGMILGTPSHMSPEQARGLAVDGRSDIFSLGTIMYEMLTGRSPFAADSTADVIAAVLNRVPPDINEQVAGVPDELKRVIEKALEKDRDKRYRSVDDLLIDLDGVRAELSPLSDRITSNGQAAKTLVMPAKRYPPYLFYSAIAVVVFAALFGGWRLVQMRGRVEMLDPAALRNVPVTSWTTFTSEGIAAARFSPDGRMIAFSSKKSGSSEIFVKLIAGGEIPVTKDGFENSSPVWSPDGQKIAFTSARSGVFGIWTVSFTGGPETQLAGGVSPSARLTRWTADGTLFIDDAAGISMIDPTTRNPKPIVDFAQLDIKPRAVAVSADGKSFAVSVKEEGVWRIKTGRLGDKNLIEVASSQNQIDTIVFSPDGNSLFYTGGSNGVAQIFQSGVDGKTAVQISNGTADLALHDVSNDGSHVLYSAVDETSDLWQVTVPDGKETVVANDVAEELWPDISPDSKNIAYQSTSQPERPYSSTIFVRPEAGGEPRPISPQGFCPVWSNDGQWIAFFQRDDSGISLWKIRPSGGDVAVIADGIQFPYLQTPYLKTKGNQISFSPDNSSMTLVRSLQGVSNIWLATLDGSNVRQLTANTDSNTDHCCAAWMHDGSHIAWLTSTESTPRSFQLRIMSSDGQQPRMIAELKERFRFLGFAAGERDALIAEKGDPTDRSQTPAETNIYAVSVDTGSMRKVSTISNAYFNNIQLSRDGRTIAFVSRTEKNTELWILPAAGGPPKKILTENDPKIMFSSLAWSPDGGSIAFGKQTRTNLLSMLTKP